MDKREKSQDEKCSITTAQIIHRVCALHVLIQSYTSICYHLCVCVFLKAQAYANGNADMSTRLFPQQPDSHGNGGS